MSRRDESNTFVEDELIPLWGWWFEISQFGRFTMRLDIATTTGKQTTGGKQRFPMPGEEVELKGRCFVVAHVDTQGVVLALVPPRPNEPQTGVKAIDMVNEHGDDARGPAPTRDEIDERKKTLLH